MVSHVISTKLNEEEHKKLLEFCNKKGCTTYDFVKNSIIESMDSNEDNSRELSLDEIREAFRVNKKVS